MVVKGYYASICHGLTFLGALANMVKIVLSCILSYLSVDRWTWSCWSRCLCGLGLSIRSIWIRSGWLGDGYSWNSNIPERSSRDARWMQGEQANDQVKHVSQHPADPHDVSCLGSNNGRCKEGKIDRFYHCTYVSF